MKITRIDKENLKHFRDFLAEEDVKFIEDDYEILPIGLVADDLKEGNNLAAGAICLRPEDYELKITSFYVSPEYRGKGAGRFLLDETKRIFGQENTEFSIEFLTYGKEEENLANFLEHYGFSFEDPLYDAREIMVSDLEKTQLMGKQGVGEAFSKIPEKLFNISQSQAEKGGAILPLGGLKAESIDKDVSVGIVKDDIIESFVVFERLSDRALLLSSFYSKGNNPVTLLHMFEASTDLILDKYSAFAKIILQPVNEAGRKLAASIYEDAGQMSCRYRYVI